MGDEMEKGIFIEDLDKNDIVSLLEMIIDFKQESDNKLSEDNIRQIKTALVEVQSTENSIILVAKDKNSIIGYICAHNVNFPLIMGKECYITDLIVSKSCRDLGVGSKLLKKLEIKSKESGCKRMMLNNPKEYDSYRRKYYAKQGFDERDNFANFCKIL